MTNIENRLNAIDNIDFWNIEVKGADGGFTKEKEGGQWGVYPEDNAPTMDKLLKILGVDFDEIEPVLDELIMSIAERVAREFGDDGSLFEVDGLTIDEACWRVGGAYEVDDGMWRYEFSDGSAICGNAQGWDIEAESEYFLMRG